MRRTVRILREADVRAALDLAGCIDACERAFVSYSTGRAERPAVIHLEVPENRGEIHVKAGHLHGSPYYATKVASGFSAVEPPVVDGHVTVFDSTDGSVAAFLLDAGYITDVRTGAAGGVAARHLAPQQVDVVAVLGTGAQAREQVAALAQVRPMFSEVRVWGRNITKAAARAQVMQLDLGGRCRVTAVGEVRQAVDGADVVITCTAAQEPLVWADMLAPGTHITAVGSDGAGKQELDPEILRQASLLVVDSADQCMRLGELQHAPDQAERAVELGLICAGMAAGRTDQASLTVCDLTGLGVQDVAAANVVMANIGRLGEDFDRMAPP
jgi:ornithine cyclodeaminase